MASEEYKEVKEHLDNLYAKHKKHEEAIERNNMHIERLDSAMDELKKSFSNISTKEDIKELSIQIDHSFIKILIGFAVIAVVAGLLIYG